MAHRRLEAARQETAKNATDVTILVPEEVEKVDSRTCAWQPFVSWYLSSKFFCVLVGETKQLNLSRHKLLLIGEFKFSRFRPMTV